MIVGGEGADGGLEASTARSSVPLLSLFVSQTLCRLISRERREDLVVLKELIEDGKVTPIVDRTYLLSEAPEAIRYLTEGHGLRIPRKATVLASDLAG